MCTMGRGHDLVLTYIQEMPGVAKEVGEDDPGYRRGDDEARPHTSGSVIALILANMPLVAQRPWRCRGGARIPQPVAPDGPARRHAACARCWRISTAAGQTDIGRPASLGHVGRAGTSAISTAKMAYFTQDRVFTLGPAEGNGAARCLSTTSASSTYLRHCGRAFRCDRPPATTRPALDSKPYIQGLPDPRAGCSTHSVASTALRSTARPRRIVAHMVYTREPISAEQLSQAQMRCVQCSRNARRIPAHSSEFPGCASCGCLHRTAHIHARRWRPRHEAMDLMMRTTCHHGP